MKNLTLFALTTALLFTATASLAQRGSKKFPVANNVQFGKMPAEVPITDPDPYYPLRVHIVSARWGGDSANYGGYGSGNILDATAPQGFDFAFDCAEPFDSNDEPTMFYPARWIKPSFRLEIRMHPAGGTRIDTCELKIALKPRPFTEEEARTLHTGATLHVSAHWTPADVAAPTAPPDFPLQLHVLSASRIESLHQIHGHAIATLPGSGDRLHLAYTCNPGFVANTQREDFFPARWTKPNEHLEVLTREPGSDHTHRCGVSVD